MCGRDDPVLVQERPTAEMSEQEAALVFDGYLPRVVSGFGLDASYDPSKRPHRPRATFS